MAWGVLVVPGLVGEANRQIRAVLIKLASPAFVATWAPAIAAPIIGESVKALGIVTVILLARRHLNTVMDGVAYGAIVGLGFEELENAHFALKGILKRRLDDSVVPVINTFLDRGLIGGLVTHIAWSAIAGAGIAWAVLRRDRSRRVRVGVGLLAFAAAWACHVLWSSGLGDDSFLAWAGIVVGILGTVGMIAGLALRDQARWCNRQLAALSEPTLATDAEIATLGSPALRFGARWNAYLFGGRQGLRATCRLQRGQAALAVALSQAADSANTEATKAAIRTAREQLAATGCPGAVPAEPGIAIPTSGDGYTWPCPGGRGRT